MHIKNERKDLIAVPNNFILEKNGQIDNER